MSGTRTRASRSFARDLEPDLDDAIFGPSAPDDTTGLAAQFEGYEIVDLAKVSLRPVQLTRVREVERSIPEEPT